MTFEVNGQQLKMQLSYGVKCVASLQMVGTDLTSMQPFPMFQLLYVLLLGYVFVMKFKFLLGVHLNSLCNP